MAAVVSINGKPISDRVRGFQIDERSQIAMLPTHTTVGTLPKSYDNTKIDEGSDCLCLEDASVWMYSEVLGWHELV